MSDEIYSLYGSDNPSALMKKFNTIGNRTLLKLRDLTTKPGSEKKPRTWNSTEAGDLVNVSAPTFRKLLEKYQSEIPGIVFEANGKGTDVKKYTLEAINFLRDQAGTRYKRPANSQPLVIAFSNLKGGVGKTANSVDFCKKIAIEGLKTLLLDFDAQGTATLISSGLVPDLELSYDDTITNALVSDPFEIQKIVRRTNFDGFDIIPANLAIQDCDLKLPNPNTNNEVALGSAFLRLKKALQLIKDDYDVIVVDCAPNVATLTINAVIACDGLIFPIPPNMADYSSFTMYTGILANLFENLPSKKYLYLRILLSKHSGSKGAEQVEEMLREQYGRFVLKNYMCETVEVAKAASEIGSIYDISKPRGNKDAYRRAVDHLDGVYMEIIGNFKNIWAHQSDFNSSIEGNIENKKEELNVHELKQIERERVYE